ncbi:MAG TPA: DUF3343 domain-containing protein [Desulfuromonadaceae bacterium]|jgi:hypothetical protein
MENRLMVKEGDLLAVFNSAHRIMKAESILKALGLPILLIPAPRKLMTDCGLAIRFNEDTQVKIMKALEQEKLMPEFVTRYESGKYIKIWIDENHPEPI